MHGSGEYFYVVFITIANVLAGLVLYALNIPLPTRVAEYSYAPVVQVSELEQPIVHSATPVRLVVPSLDIDIAVKEGSFDAKTGVWTDNGLNASFADASVPVNDNNGTTVIYAHAQWGAFAALPTIKPGATAKVYAESGDVYVYKAKEIHEVTPNDTSVFRVSGPPRLVLQTCSGAWDAYRMLVYFDFVELKT